MYGSAHTLHAQVSHPKEELAVFPAWRTRITWHLLFNIATPSPAQAGTETEDVSEDNDFSAMDSEDENIHANSTAALPNRDPSFTNSEK